MQPRGEGGGVLWISSDAADRRFLGIQNNLKIRGSPGSVRESTT